MPNLDPNFDPRSATLPQIPEEIKDLMLKEEKQRRMILYIIISIIVLVIIVLIYWGLGKLNNKYSYLQIISRDTNTINNQTSGPDINKAEVQIKNAKFYFDKVIDAPSDKKTAVSVILNANTNSSSYYSVGKNGDFIILKSNIDLADANADTLTIYENNIGKNEEYDVLAGKSSTGPWVYLGRYAGTANIDLKDFFKN